MQSENIAISRLTTLEVGGMPERTVTVTDNSQLGELLSQLWRSGDEYLVIGGGSNLLVSDSPFSGTVIRLQTKGIAKVPGAQVGYQRVHIAAGENWDEVVAWSVRSGLAGIEAMSGIPGNAGAVPIQNVGAYGQDISQTLVSIDFIDDGASEVVQIPAVELGLGLRTSVLKHHYGSPADRIGVVTGITLDLRIVAASGFAVESKQLAAALGLSTGETVTLGWIREHVLATRAAKGMVWNANDPDTHSAGSFFQNPIVSAEIVRTLPANCPKWPLFEAADVAAVISLADYDGSVPGFDAAPDRYKVSAAWLIEYSGMLRGFSLPGSRASLSTKHALAITNRGGASADEIAELARFVRSRVFAETGVLLDPEPVVIGLDL